MWGIIIGLIVGAIAGWLAGLLVKGEGYGIVVNIIIGIIGGLIGQLLLAPLGLDAENIIGSILVATFGAVVLLVIVRAISGARM